MHGRDIVLFGTSELALPAAVRRQTIPAVLRGAALGAIGALLVDARSPRDLFRAHELLRALFDDPRRGAPLLHPRRVLVLIRANDVRAAFAFGHYAVLDVVEEEDLATLPARLREVVASRPEPALLTTPAWAAPRPGHLARREPGQPPTVALAYRHPDETLALLERYTRALSAPDDPCPVFSDVALLFEVMVREGLTCQTNLATKAGATDTGQFIGSFDFYRQLRRSRYALVPDDPSGQVSMHVFIAVDEILHELLHLLFLANETRAGLAQPHTLFAEELSVGFWQAAVHHRVFPQWHDDHRILEINDDFLLDASKAEERGFWRLGKVFDGVRELPWVQRVIGCLPERSVYIGERPDLDQVLRVWSRRKSAQFAVLEPERLRIPGPRPAAPRLPSTFRVLGAEPARSAETEAANAS